MNEYTGKICPHCNMSINESDAVVVCPVCGNAHHVGCWQAHQGCSIVGCSANPQYTAAPAPAVCSACGAPVADGQAFCANCGHKVAAAAPVAAENPVVAPVNTVVPPVAAPVSNPNAAYGGNYNYSAPVNPAISQFNATIQQQNEKKKKKPLGIILGVIAAIIVICIIASAGPKVDDIKLSDVTLELRVDDTYSLTYAITPSDASDADVTWSSSNSSVATVSSSGRVTAVGEGTCVITAKAGGETATVSVTVTSLRAEEKMLIGTWDVVGYLQDGDITTLSSHLASAYMYDDLTGKMTVGDTVLNFTWTYSKYDDGTYYYSAVVSDGGKMNFIYMTEYEYLVFDLGDMQVIFEK